MKRVSVYWAVLYLVTNTTPTPITTKYQLRIPVALKLAVEQAAQTQRITPSQLVRNALVAHLDLTPQESLVTPPPITNREKTKRANDKRKIALKALKHLQRTNPALLQELAAKMQKEGAA